MLPTVHLRKVGIATSRLGFGTSRLHYLSRRERERLLATAADLGFVHFDTAPAYGDGLAETELGRLLRHQGTSLVVATKYGIPADPIIEHLPSLGFALRASRSLARKAGYWRPSHPAITAAGLRKSAEQSLRRLQRDYVDILMLHEPTPARLSEPSRLLEELVGLQQRGLIRAFGLAGDWKGIEAIRSSTPELAQIIQTAEGQWPDACPPDITYGAVSSSEQTYFARTPNCGEAVQRLRRALLRRPDGVVVVSTTKIHNLRQLADVAHGLA
jgi:aryl-alcohol dehydrogenase-like predicted oxidoreductase